MGRDFVRLVLDLLPDTQKIDSCDLIGMLNLLSRKGTHLLDSTISSITPGRLRQFFADYGKDDTVVKEVMLDTLLPSQQAPRSSRK